jgi:hypothetical protein
MKQHVTTLGRVTSLSSGLLVLGAALVDTGALLKQPALEQLGNALAALAGLGLICLPYGLRASGVGGDSRWVPMGTGTLLLGLGFALLIELPPIFDPADLSTGRTFGPLGLVLLSTGFLAWFAAIHESKRLGGWRKWIFLLAGIWFLLTFPTIQLPLFVFPYGRPSLLLLAGVPGATTFLIGKIIQEQAAPIGPYDIPNT